MEWEDLQKYYKDSSKRLEESISMNFRNHDVKSRTASEFGNDQAVYVVSLSISVSVS